MTEKKKILLIDDEKDFTELTGSLLGFRGFEVDTLNDSSKALDLLKAKAYDAVVIDIMMPEVDGITLMRQLRETEAYVKTTMVALSAKKLSDEERKFLLTQRIHFVQKPFRPQRLVDILRESFAG